MDGGGLAPLCREAVGLFYSPSRLGKESFGRCFLIVFPLYTSAHLVIFKDGSKLEKMSECLGFLFFILR